MAQQPPPPPPPGTPSAMPGPGARPPGYGGAQSDIDAATSVLLALGAVLLIVHLGQVVSGWLLLRGRARGLAGAMAIIGGVILLVVLILGLGQGTVDPIGLVMALAAIARAITVPILLGRARMAPAA